MIRQNKNTICSILFGVLLAVSPVTVSGAEPAKKAPLAAADLERLAQEAKTPADHAVVAKRYEERASSLLEKAEKLENELRRERAAPSAMATKWPAMVNGARERKEQLAMQNRRAAEESTRLARHHRSLAGETEAGE